jgi:hypothetical protein
MGSDWAEMLPRLYHPDLRLVISVPLPQEGEPRDKNLRMFEEVMDSCARSD